MRTQWLENTTPDIEQALARDPIAVLPIGSIEQHGRHVPVGYDTLAASRIAQGFAIAIFVKALWYFLTIFHVRAIWKRTLRGVSRLPTSLPTKENDATNQGYQDCHKPLISLVGKLPTKSTNRGGLVGW